ncbi:hypothetical protein [Mycolicibacterium sp. lyk4-40-TYG-92]|uniref:hypothetical protein n=1 Tax=Mycolicibacterium sp. lyk4-40-TYG-92 TaxID=3040295 RepID=UPI00254AA3D9|nr:hypothetical protein [Mycolicibacterium sp. lyk4-40-TYG-92]
MARVVDSGYQQGVVGASAGIGISVVTMPDLVRIDTDDEGPAVIQVVLEIGHVCVRRDMRRHPERVEYFHRIRERFTMCGNGFSHRGEPLRHYRLVEKAVPGNL